MKKHNEGYTLPLVLVVMIVMCLIAVSVMSVALHNLQTQKASVARMQDKYVAQGEIEKAVARIEHGLVSPPALYAAADVNVGTTQGEIQQIISNASAEGVVCTLLKWIEEDPQSCTVKISYKSETVGIECVIRLTGVIDADNEIKTPEITYDAYAISAISQEVPDDA